MDPRLAPLTTDAGAAPLMTTRSGSGHGVMVKLTS
jgi:hypothetical protein